MNEEDQKCAYCNDKAEGTACSLPCCSIEHMVDVCKIFRAQSIEQREEYVTFKCLHCNGKMRLVREK